MYLLSCSCAVLAQALISGLLDHCNILHLAGVPALVKGVPPLAPALTSNIFSAYSQSALTNGKTDYTFTLLKTLQCFLIVP